MLRRVEMGTFTEHMYEGFKYKLYIPNQSLEDTPLPMVVCFMGVNKVQINSQMKLE